MSYKKKLDQFSTKLSRFVPLDFKKTFNILVQKINDVQFSNYFGWADRNIYL